MSTALPDVDFQHVKELGNELLAQIDAVRAQDPIFWSNSQRAWIVSGHAEVAEGFSGKLPFSNERMSKVGRFMPDPAERARRIPTVLRLYPLQLVGMDPPAQGRMRRLLMPAFSRTAVERTRIFARQAISAAFAQALPNTPVDFVASIARVIPARVILHLTGLTDKYLPNLPHWSASVIAGLGGGANTPEVLDETERTFVAMEAALNTELRARRQEPRQDFLSTLATAEFDGDRLSDDEIISTVMMTLLAGNDTTGNTLGLSAVALARSPQAWPFLRANPDAMPNAVMEIMRHIAMSTTQSRMVARDFEWKGHHLRQGDLVYLMVAGANRDPAKFPDPERLELQRPQDGNMTFGPGLHMCIGHLVAKMQLEEFFRALVDRYGGIEVLDEHLDWHTSLAFRGLRSLNVRFIPRLAPL
jgi:pimeloyl-[acyl-carrier protein] synthase